jgi:hypothetical protein
VVAGDDPDVLVQPVAAHGRAVAAAPIRRDRPLAPVDEGDRAVPQPGEVVDGLADALGVRRPHHVHPVGGNPAPDHHHGQLPRERTEVGGRRHRAQQHQRLAAEVDQRLDRPALVTGAGHRAQHHVVALPLGDLVEVLDQLGMEGAADVHHHADQVGPPPGEQAGGPVPAVAQRGGRLQHPLARCRAGTGRVAQHHRHRRRGHPDPCADVLEPRTATGTRRIAVRDPVHRPLRHVQRFSDRRS